MKNVVEFKNVHKSYGKKKVLNDISFNIEQGTIVCLQGANGAGKTTIIKIICDMLKVDGGKVLFNGSTKLIDDIGYMSQHFSLYKNMTVKENMHFFARIYNLDFVMVDSQIKRFGLEEYVDYKLKNLSGGWKQKVSLACATLHNPKLLILDEPTAGVDPVSRKEIWDIISQFTTDGMSILVTTHNIDEIFKSDKVVFINNGKIVLEQLPPNKLLDYYGIETIEELYYRAVKGEVYAKA
ncbi:ABC transporter ATP-binding protein [Mollicutes bacterium LVI A0039]|nr:ABC transporter ATP-binding protein [Mollicutes bacterium LVI A0039]